MFVDRTVAKVSRFPDWRRTPCAVMSPPKTPLSGKFEPRSVHSPSRGRCDRSSQRTRPVMSTSPYSRRSEPWTAGRWRSGSCVTTTVKRARKAAVLQEWAEAVESHSLIVVDTAALKELGRLARERAALESEVEAAVRSARAASRSWSEIGAMPGVSKQAAQRKCARRSRAA